MKLITKFFLKVSKMATGSYGRYAGYIFDPVSIYIYPEPCGNTYIN